MSLYIDGALKNDSSIVAHANNSLASTGRFFIGAYGNETGSTPYAGYCFPGSLDEGQLMSAAASADWVPAEYMNRYFRVYGGILC
jgi:hypothetical protein